MPDITVEEFETDMKEMETRMKVLRAEYNQYLTGIMKAPPNFTVALLRKLIRKYAMVKGLKGVQRFRYYNLVAKFNTMMEFYNRRIREKQEGKQFTYGYVKTDPALAESHKDHKELHKQTEFVPDKGHVISDASTQNATLRHMYDKWKNYNEKTRGDIPKVEFKKFQDMIHKKTQQIQDKSNCRAVKYKIVLVDGKIKINAKTIK